jgi:hypothetical protein
MAAMRLVLFEVVNMDHPEEAPRTVLAKDVVDAIHIITKQQGRALRGYRRIREVILGY